MRIFFFGCSLLVISLVIHVLLWKVRLPKSHTSALLIIFFSVFLAGAGAAVVLSVPVWDFLQIALFFWSASLCYVITYSAVEADSPTLSLMRFLAEKESEGCSELEIMAFMAKRPFIQARLTALLSSSMVRQEAGRYFVAGKPSLPFQVLLGFRKVYGTIPKGG